MHVILFAGLMLGLFTTGMDTQTNKYDAPIPQKCATFHDRYDYRNKEFCMAWIAEHKAAVVDIRSEFRRLAAQ